MSRSRILLVLSAVIVAVAVAASVAMLLRSHDEQPGSAPPQATAAVATLLSSDDVAQLRTVLSPPVARALAPDQPTPPSEPVRVELADWGAQGPFAAATALVGPTDRQQAIDVGFRLVDGQWRITFARVRR